MALQYDVPSSSTDFEAALAANPTLSPATQEAITAILGDSETIAVGYFDGTTLTAPANTEVDAVVAAIPGAAGEKVTVDLPDDAMASASVWVFNSDADLTVNFNTIERVIASGNGNDTIAVAGDKNTALDGGRGNDTLTTSGGDDSVTGGAGNDSISTGAGDDTIVAGEGNDTINGGTGFDVVQIEGDSSDFDFDFDVTGHSLVATAKDGSAVVAGVNTEIFSFGTIDNVVVTSNETEAQAMRLYEAFFDRSADVEGAEYWLDGVARGLTATDVAQSFMATEEFQSKGEMSNEDYVYMLYLNGLERTPDAEGKEFWVASMDNGLDRADVAIGIVGSAEAADTIENVVIITGTV